MQTFDQALFDHLKAGRVTMEEALKAATSPHDFKLLVAADGRRGTTMDDLADNEARRSEAAAARRADRIRRVEHWDLRAHPVEPHRPAILDSARGESRSIVLHLPAGEALQDHEVHERAHLVVVEGEVEVDGRRHRDQRRPGGCSTSSAPASATRSARAATRGCCSSSRRGRATAIPGPATDDAHDALRSSTRRSRPTPSRCRTPSC